jgi:putative exosortase-associated protein (TIGR04073 family)
MLEWGANKKEEVAAMQSGRTVYAMLFGVVMLCQMPTVAQAQMQPGGAVSKLGRGIINVFTGWVEIPKRVIETSQASGTAAGWTWGLLRGFGHGFVRTAAGFYELFTFPFPAPPDYESVIQPEFVFQEEAASR